MENTTQACNAVNLLKETACAPNNRTEGWDVNVKTLTEVHTTIYDYIYSWMQAHTHAHTHTNVCWQPCIHEDTGCTKLFAKGANNKHICT